ncbi:hypothetical protein [Micromonospora costi]|nr:hypothetical protein [Micromonospora costi]
MLIEVLADVGGEAILDLPLAKRRARGKKMRALTASGMTRISWWAPATS